MSTQLAALEGLKLQITEMEGRLATLKKSANILCALANMPSIYEESESGSSPSFHSIRSDQFYGQPMASVIRELLLMRKAAGQGAATVAELYDAMVKGGYDFQTSDPDNAKRGLRVSLTKNTATFHKIPQGGYGLLEWYPNAKLKKQSKVDGADAGQSSGDEPESDHPKGGE